MSSFTITAAKEVKLDAKGRGSVPVTVTNTTNRQVRGTPKLKAMGSTPEKWLALAENGTRAFQPEQSQQFVVQINVPPDAPAGDYSFGLNVCNEATPEEDFTEGPAVAFKVTPRPVPPPPQPSRWWIWVVVAVVVIGGGVTAWLLWPSGPEPVPVPRLIGLTEDKVQELPATFRYQKLGEEHTGTQSPGTIAKQQPDPDTKQKPGELVLYTVEAASPFIGAWVPESGETGTVARYNIRQEGNQLRVHVWSRDGRAARDEGEHVATQDGNKLHISWGRVPTRPATKAPAAPTGLKTKAMTKAASDVAIAASKAGPLILETFGAHRQTLTLTSDGRLLVEEGNTNVTFKRMLLIHVFEALPRAEMMKMLKEP